MNPQSAGPAIVSVAVVSALITLVLGKSMLEWYPIPLPGIAGRIVLAIAFAIAATIAGFIAQSVYGRALAGRPETAPSLYQWIGLGVATALTVAGIVVYAILKRGPVVAWTLLNFAWGIGYGMWLPRLLE